jgi:hypothetical protein
VLGQLVATGTADQVSAWLEPWEDLADVVVIGLPPGVPWEVIEATLRAAAPQTLVEEAGSARTRIADHRMGGPFLPVNTQIAGIATKGN